MPRNTQNQATAKKTSSNRSSKSKSAATKTPKKPNAIEVRGARQHNLKGIDVDLPLGQLTVVTGPSGSGKSSFAFHTLYAEGQRRYVETFSPYVRQFFDRMDKPQVDRIDHIPPAIAIEQKNQIRTTRSTVGTLTEVNDYLKLLYPRLAKGYHPKTGEEILPDSPTSATAWAIENMADCAVLISFPVPIPDETTSSDLFPFLQSQGYLRILTEEGEILRTDDNEDFKNPSNGKVTIVQDRVKVSPRNRARLFEAFEAAFRLGRGSSTIHTAEHPQKNSHTFSTSWAPLQKPTSALFTFNNPLGACPECRGFGRVIGIDLRKAIPNHSLSILAGCVKPFQGERGEECQIDLERFAPEVGIDLNDPFRDLTPDQQDWILYGEGGPTNHTESLWQDNKWYGVKGFFDWLETKSYKMHVRIFLARYRSYTECASCRGNRLRPEALAFKIHDATLPDLWRMPIDQLANFFNTVSNKLPSHLVKEKSLQLILNEITTRLDYLQRVGLSYLTLDRPARSLSGGEIARVNLTTCLGTSLSQTLFVLDEPTVGLHPRDINALIGVMHDLTAKGNTLIVVEHDEAVMRAAHQILDIGPQSGHLGGDLVYQGPILPKSKRNEAKGSITMPYLNGIETIPLPERRRPSKEAINIEGIYRNNLNGLNVQIPLGVFTCLTGLSGSGKSTLAHDALYLNLARALHQEISEEPVEVTSFDYPKDSLNRVLLVDQTPLARTPKSTPAVYLGAFEAIRTLFTLTPEAKAAGLKPGYFSFNSGTGRCERCSGNGFEKVEMQFLSDLYLTCPECEGSRYSKSSQAYTYDGHSISDILKFTVEHFITWSDQLQKNVPAKEQKLLAKSSRLLSPLKDVGLDYLRLGQALNTLSGGESQRLKLCQLLAENQLASSGSFLILDEPTTGLHFTDISRLNLVFQRLVEQGHSLLVIEHNLDVLKCADHLIDLGPDAGDKGGQIVAQGTPEEVAKCNTHTGKALREILASQRKAPKALKPKKTPPLDTISIVGARHHNLKNVSVEIPRDEMVVVTGLSGSGKSTLAFDLVFAEGQRRFLDSMSPYARQFAEQLEKPDVDRISGLPPTVAIEQRISRGGGKSTVATVTELYHFLRLLYAKVGIQHCPTSGEPVVSQTEDAILQTLIKEAKAPGKGTVSLMTPVVRGRKGFHTDVATWAGRQGYEKLLVDLQFQTVTNFQPLARFSEHDIDVVIYEFDRKCSSTELLPKLQEALRLGKGSCRVLTKKKKLLPLSTSRVSPSTGRSFEAPDPAHFSFNSPRGWCSSCRGYGQITHHRNKMDASAFNSVSEAELDYERKLDRSDEDELITCPECAGSRLREESRHVYLTREIFSDKEHLNANGLSLSALTSLSVHQAEKVLSGLNFAGREAEITHDIIPELRQRLHFLSEVGLGYLSLNRSANTLSGGEAQRIRLAAQLGSNLHGVLYVLDEPTIGLHPRDNVTLLHTLRALQGKGNSLLIVEHDEETMAQADTEIHLGPGAGRLGGEVTHISHRSKKEKHLTQNFLPLPSPPRRALPSERSRTGWIKVRGCHHNNLKSIDVAIPLGRLTVLTGVSGCGKSSLMRGTLKPAFDFANGKKSIPKTWSSLSGFTTLKACYEVDQTPIGKTSRSCPATYIKILDDIRKLFASLPEARMRGFSASRFSFNNAEGQCPECKGNGRIKLEMDFLPATWIDCESCQGQRYNPATLEVTYHHKHMGEVLQMTITEATEFFAAVPKLKKTLQLLSDTGLGYLQLGQPSPTLSGGEAQRMKLVSQLIRGRSPKAALAKATQTNLYLIEEPSIGLHHNDVARLIEVLHRLVEEGHTIVVIEHHMDLAAQADYLIDMGPEAGSNGGTIVAAGTPEQVTSSKQSRTAPFLKSSLP